MRTKLLHYFHVQEHKKLSKKKAVKQGMARSKNGSNCVQCCGDFCDHLKTSRLSEPTRVGGQSNKMGGQAKIKKTSNHVSLTDKCPIHPDSTHTWGNCYQNVINKDKKLPAKGTRTGKTSTHGANLMDIKPTEKVTCLASLLEITAINESKLSRDELNAYMLESFNKTLGCPGMTCNVSSQAI
jgi:hypothetical protein